MFIIEKQIVQELERLNSRIFVWMKNCNFYLYMIIQSVSMGKNFPHKSNILGNIY